MNHTPVLALNLRFNACFKSLYLSFSLCLFLHFHSFLLLSVVLLLLAFMLFRYVPLIKILLFVSERSIESDTNAKWINFNGHTIYLRLVSCPVQTINAFVYNQVNFFLSYILYIMDSWQLSTEYVRNSLIFKVNDKFDLCFISFPIRLWYALNS